MIRRCRDNEVDQIWAIINDGANAYRGVIPEDCCNEPYMSLQELQHEIDDGVVFWGYEENGLLAGVMGLQQLPEVALIRHAYVLGEHQKRGIGARLLHHLLDIAHGPVLVGTWADAVWAIRFYEKHGFELTADTEKEHLLRAFWSISERQVETSVVLKRSVKDADRPSTSIRNSTP